MPDDTVLNLRTIVNIQPVQQGMREAAGAVSENVTAINSQFREMMAQASAAGDAVLAQAAAFRASGLSEQEAASALKNLGFTSQETGRAISNLSTQMGSSNSAMSDFQSAVKSSMSGASGAVQEAEGQINNSMKGIRAGIVATGSGFRVVARGMSTNMYLLAAAIAATVGYQIIKSLNDAELAMVNFADATGIPIKAVAELDASLQQFGAKAGAGQTLFRRLQEAIMEAGAGSKSTADDFKALGINVEEWHGIIPNTNAVLLQLAQYLALNKGNAQAMAVAMKLLGDETGASVAFLSQGDAAVEKMLRSNAAYGDSAAGAAEGTRKLNEQWESAKTKIETALLPALGALGNALERGNEAYERENAELHEWMDVMDNSIPHIQLTAQGIDGLRVKIISAGDDAVRAAQDFKTMADSITEATQGGLRKPTAGDAQIFQQKEIQNQLNGLKKIMGEYQQDLDSQLQSQEATYKTAEQIEANFWNDKLKTAQKGSAEYFAIAVEARRAEKSYSEQEYSDVENKFQQQKAAQEAYGTWSTSDTINYWTEVLQTTKLASAQQTDILKTINEAKHQLGVEELSDKVAQDEEFIASVRRGSSEYLAEEKKRQQDVLTDVHATAKEKIDADKQYLEAELEVSKTAAEDAIHTAEVTADSYKAGDQRRVDSFALAIARIKVLQDSLKNELAADQTKLAANPDDSNLKLRVNLEMQALETLGRSEQEAAQKWGTAEREKTSVMEREENERTRIALEASEKTAEMQIAGYKRAEEESIKSIERIAQYDLLSLNQKASLIRQAIDLEHQRATEAIDGAEAEVRAQLQLATTEEQKINLTRRLMELQEQQTRLDLENTQKQINLNDQMYEDEMRRAMQAFNVISESWDRAVGQMITTHTNFRTVMEHFWVDMVEGWMRMGIQILGQYVATMAAILMRTILTELQITTIHSQQVTLRSATDKLWQELLAVLGIKTVSQQTQTEGQQTAAHGAGVTARAAVTKAGDTADAEQEALATTASINYSAAAGAAAAFASVMEALPFPANVSTAPGVAAGVLAAIEGFNVATGVTAAADSGIAAGAKGSLVERDQLMLVHQGESVIPKEYTQHLRTMGTLDDARPTSGGASPDILDKLGLHTYDTKLPDDIAKNITTAFTNTTEAKAAQSQTNQSSTSISSSMANMLKNVSINMASAAGGMDVPHDMVAKIHEGETVLPEHLSSGIKNLIAGGASKSGDTHVTNNNSPVHVSMSAHGQTTTEMEKHFAEIGPKYIKKWVRQGKLKLR